VVSLHAVTRSAQLSSPKTPVEQHRVKSYDSGEAVDERADQSWPYMFLGTHEQGPPLSTELAWTPSGRAACRSCGDVLATAHCIPLNVAGIVCESALPPSPCTPSACASNDTVASAVRRDLLRDLLRHMTEQCLERFIVLSMRARP
jgi:hypothetical protein